ncbi:hypothetical protein ANANG_G00272160 [Anguilla anguilla]|uniref:A-kinase anchor protein 11 n=1 Tax=Anguilla anguilla TaxID=7936 RepID=A0A9D3LM37_ANGAN|nr:hypothetical protein ANANG_G00272160 [Anguilla anguilla]
MAGLGVTAGLTANGERPSPHPPSGPAMDPSARIQGVPLKTRGSFRKESFSPISPLGLQTLVRSRKELCTVVLELHGTEAPCLTEIHFVCLPSQAEGDHFTLQALPSVPAKLLELLKSLHVHSLTDEEVLLLEESKKLLERNRSAAQTSRWSQAACVLRRPHSPSCSTAAILALLSRYMAGFRYALELQALHRSVPDGCQAEDDDTNQSVSSIEDDFVTALEHLEKDDATDNLLAAPFSHRSQRDAASQTVPSHRRDGPESSVIISSRGKGSPAKPANRKPCLDVSVSVQSSVPAWASGPESQWSFFSPSPQKGHASSAPLTESEESDCSSPSPVIFLDEVGYQKSLEAKLDIPKIPVLKGGVEDSDSEVSEFFDSFDRFDDLDQAPESTSEPPNEMNTAGQTQKNTFPEDCTSKAATTAMNPHRFDHPVLPANIKKPTPLKPGSPYGSHPDIPDSPRPIMPFCEESGALFSPVQPSAFSPMGEGASMEHLGRADEECSELHKPQDLCTLYKKYSDFASNISKEILSSVCGYSSPVDMNVNKNLSCVCHKEFTNSSGHLMRLSEIQEAVTVSQSQKPHTLKEGIQKFATDLVEMSLGSAFRDLQKGVATCTTTLCHLAARLTSSVFQVAFQEIGARHAYVLKEHAVNGLAGFLVGEAVSGALKEFHFVKKQIFNNAVARFAADLAEELVFEGIMEVCQFSHPSTPLTPSDWSFQREEEVVSAYASDLSESVLQEAFIELSQADVTFTTEAAISVSLDNIRYDSLEVPSFELAGRGCKKFAHEELLHSPERTCSGDPGTPPSTPQQGPPASQEKQIKQFSKKLKSKLAKEFSPATPPPTPRYQPFGAVTETGGEAGKADFILKLMRSLSDEAGGMEDVQDSQEYTCGPGTAAKYCQVELNLPGETDHKMVEKGALCYAGRLASHIVSMATEMDNLGLEDGRKFEDIGGKDGLPVRTAQFSEETLNSLWAYAGEIAGEVISDVMKMTDVSHCRHRALKRTGEICPECHQHVDHRDFRLTTMVDRWSSDLLASVISVQSSELSGHSSGNPNCESVKDEDASYLIRVLQRGGGQRELILDQYASHLAYRSIRAGLAQAEKRIKQRSNLRLNSFRGLHHNVAYSGVGHDGANFAESLATEIMASALTNVCQTINISPLGRERTHTLELLGSQGRSLSAEGRSLSSREDSQGRTLSSGEDSQGRSLSTEGRSLSSGEDSLGSWSNLSLEDEHLDESSSFLHLSDSNGNSSSWSSLGLEGEEPVSLSPSNSDGPEEKEAESAADVNAAQVCPATVRLLVLNSDLGGPSLDPQVRAVLQWIAASHSDLPTVQLGQSGEVELQQLPAVVCRVRQRGWTAGDLLQALLQYCEGPETQPGAQGPCSKPFFHWLLEHA